MISREKWFSFPMDYYSPDIFNHRVEHETRTAAANGGGHNAYPVSAQNDLTAFPTINDGTRFQTPPVNFESLSEKNPNNDQMHRWCTLGSQHWNFQGQQRSQMQAEVFEGCFPDRVFQAFPSPLQHGPESLSKLSKSQEQLPYLDSVITSKKSPGTELEHMPLRKRKGTKRRTSKDPTSCEASIRWDDLGLDENISRTVFSIIPQEKINQFLSDGACPLVGGMGMHLNPEQERALKTVKQKLRAEKKSRREKQRRVHVNNSLTALATKINVKPEEQDMNSILISAARYIEEQQREIVALKKQLGTK